MNSAFFSVETVDFYRRGGHQEDFHPIRCPPPTIRMDSLEPGAIIQIQPEHRIESGKGEDHMESLQQNFNQFDPSVKFITNRKLLTSIAHVDRLHLKVEAHRINGVFWITMLNYDDSQTKTSGDSLARSSAFSDKVCNYHGEPKGPFYKGVFVLNRSVLYTAELDGSKEDGTLVELKTTIESPEDWMKRNGSRTYWQSRLANIGEIQLACLTRPNEKDQFFYKGHKKWSIDEFRKALGNDVENLGIRRLAEFFEILENGVADGERRVFERKCRPGPPGLGECVWRGWI